MPGAVLLSGRERFAMPVRPTDTIGMVRNRISKEAGCIDVVQVKLVLLGVQLDPEADDRTLLAVKMQEGT